MNRIKIFYLTVISLSLICTACNFQQSVSESAGNITPSAIINVVTPTNTLLPTSSPSPKLASTATPSPTSTPIPTPTLGPIDQQAIELLNLSEEEYCSEVYGYQCHAIIKTKILDYLHQHPNSSYRQQLLDKTLEFGLWINPQWIIEDWLKRTIFELAESPDTTEKLNEFEEKWGKIIATDLDNNGETDYLVAVQLHDLSCQSFGQMYWVYQIHGDYQVELLPTTMYDSDRQSMYPTVLSTDDLTGDGFPEVTYVAISCGPSDQFQKPRILSWQDDRFVDRLIGYWYLTNGDLAIHDKDGIAEITLTQGETGYPGVPPYFSYDFHLKLQDGEYIPVHQTPLFQPDINQRDGDILYWQWANYLLHTNHFKEAADAYTTVAQQTASFFDWVDYRPYALFRLGLAQILLGNIEAAQKSWDQLISEFPNHPISLDTTILREKIKDKEDFARACVWLQENGKRWSEPQWAASERQIVFTKWQNYLHEEQGEMDYSEWLKSEEPIDYDNERKNLEYVSGPQNYGLVTGWQDLCHPIFFSHLYTWNQQETVEAQMNQLGTVWETLTTVYDLNNDGVSDPIGVWEVNGWTYLWSFISQNDNYHPLLVTQPYPIEAIDIWQVEGYEYGNMYFVPEAEFTVTDSNGDNMPEITAMGNYFEGKYRWVGNRFEYEPSVRVSQLDNSPDLLIKALVLLFQERNHQHALELLHQYSPANEWEEATQLFFEALALQYSNQSEQANAAFQKIVNNYPDTGWSLLAREKLEYNGN